MQKFSFKENKDVLIPESNNFQNFKDKNGNPIVNDALICKFADIAESYETKNRQPVPIEQQSFILWLKEAAGFIRKGGSSEEFFKRTIVRS